MLVGAGVTRVREYRRATEMRGEMMKVGGTRDSYAIAELLRGQSEELEALIYCTTTRWQKSSSALLDYYHYSICPSCTAVHSPYV